MLFDSGFVGPLPQDALAFIAELLQSSAEYAFIVNGMDGKIHLWNEGARRLYGYDVEEAVGRVESNALHTPEDIEAGRVALMMEEALRYGKWEGILTQVRNNGLR